MEAPSRQTVILISVTACVFLEIGLLIPKLGEGREKQAPTASEAPSEERSDDITWRTKAFSGLSISLPFDLSDGESSTGHLPPSVQNAAESAMYYGNNDEQLGVSITVAKLKPGASIDMASAAQGIIHRIARKLSAEVHNYVALPDKEADYECFNVSYIPEGYKMTARARLMRKGNTYWQLVMVDYTQLNADKMNWIVDSIKL